MFILVYNDKWIKFENENIELFSKIIGIIYIIRQITIYILNYIYLLVFSF